MKVIYNFGTENGPDIISQSEYPGEKLNLWVWNYAQAESLYNSMTADARSAYRVFWGQGESRREFSPPDSQQNIGHLVQ